MARPSAGDPPVSMTPAPYQTTPSGMPASVVPPSPFNYTNQPNMPGPGMQVTPTPGGLLNAFRRRWVLGTFLGLLFAAAAMVCVWLALPGGKHETRAVVQIRSRSSEFGTKSNDEFNEYRNRQLFLLRSRDLITRTTMEPAISSLDMVKGTEDPVQMFEEHLKVRAATDDIMVVSLTGNNLDEMKVFLEHLIKRYLDDAIAYDRKDLDDRIKKCEQSAERLQQEIDARKKQIELLGRANSTTGGEDNAKKLAVLQQRFVESDAAYNRLGRELVGLEAEFKVLKEQLDGKTPKNSPDPDLVEQVIGKDPNVIRAKAQLEVKKLDYKKALDTAGGNEEAPYVKEKKTELDNSQLAHGEAKKLAMAEAIETARVIEAATRKARLEQLAFTIKVKKEEREQFQDERDNFQKKINQSVGGGLDIQAMRDQLKPQQDILDKTNLALASLRMEATLGNRVTMRGEVEKVPNHNQNKKILFSGAGGLAAFFGVVLLVAFLEWRTRRIDGVDQVVTELGMRVIGTVPLFPNRANLKAAVEAGGANWRFVLNESINSTRTMLLHAARTQSMQVVMVTSATQGEGKTSLASQLATSMATAGMRTLIVDCDLRNPSIQKLFEVPLGPGVSEVLRQEIDVSDAVQATTVPNLWVIPAGQCSNATIVALAQGHPLETLFNRLRGQFDFVIVDSCPVLPVADALLIGQHVDGVLFSIMQDISQLPKVMTASEKLTHLGIPLVGAVVNGIKQDVYSYGYNYVKQLPA